ncbi:BMP family lipoprotein [Nesterenkonia populi]
MNSIFSRVGTALATTAALVLTACGGANEEEPEEEVDVRPSDAHYGACLISDQGGWDDESFNQSAYEGVMRAVDDFGIGHDEAQSTYEWDYEPNMEEMLEAECDLIFGVGFMLEETINATAAAQPDTEFALIDEVISEEHENARTLVFNTGEAAYLAGYLAAAMTESGTVGTWGGIQLPSVAVFMDGFADGVDRYNEDNGEDVELVGWDKETQEGSFSGDFTDTTQGELVTEQLLAWGADIIMPVAGNAGLGAGDMIVEAEAAMIWVDSDGYHSTRYGDVILTSVKKQISEAVYDTIEEGEAGRFSNETYIGDLENEGVGLAPFHTFEDEVPQQVSDDLERLREEIISGETVLESENAPKQ